MQVAVSSSETPPTAPENSPNPYRFYARLTLPERRGWPKVETVHSLPGGEHENTPESGGSDRHRHGARGHGRGVRGSVTTFLGPEPEPSRLRPRQWRPWPHQAPDLSPVRQHAPAA